MSSDSLSVEILRDIRDELRATRTELKSEIAQTRTELKAEISQTRTELKAELSQTNARLAVVEVTLKDFAGQHLMLTRYVKNVANRHEGAIEDLDERVTKLEDAD